MVYLIFVRFPSCGICDGMLEVGNLLGINVGTVDDITDVLLDVVFW